MPFMSRMIWSAERYSLPLRQNAYKATVVAFAVRGLMQ